MAEKKKRQKVHQPTDEARNLIKKLVIAGIKYETIADVLEISHDTLTRHYNDILKTAKAVAVSAIAEGLYNRALNGDNTCAIFYLKTQGRWRETDGEAEGIEKKDNVRLIVLEKPSR